MQANNVIHPLLLSPQRQFALRSLLVPLLLAAAALACDPGSLVGGGGATPAADAGLLQTQLALDERATSLAETEQAIALPSEPSAAPPPTEAPLPTAVRLPTAAPLSATATRPPVGAGSDQYEPDDTPEQASLITPNGDPQLHNFGKASDEDWISFDGLKGQRYTIKTFNLGKESDTFVELFNSNGSSLGYDDDGAGKIYGPSVLIFNCGRDGRYYIKVRNYFHGNVGNQATYSFQITAK